MNPRMLNAMKILEEGIRVQEAEEMLKLSRMAEEENEENESNVPGMNKQNLSEFTTNNK